MNGREGWGKAAETATDEGVRQLNVAGVQYGNDGGQV
jgi:hypothetical protein